MGWLKFPQRNSPPDIELCYPFGRKRRRPDGVPPRYQDQVCLIGGSLMGGIRRREFITLVGGAALTWPVAPPAQPKVPVVGWLSAQAARGRFSETFVEGLKDSGFVEGRNVIIENRFADGRNDRLPALAAELVQRGVSVIAAPLAAA